GVGSLSLRYLHPLGSGGGRIGGHLPEPLPDSLLEVGWHRIDSEQLRDDAQPVVLAAELTLQTTPAGRVGDVFHWLLGPVPGVNAGRVALMAGLALRHVVVLGDLYRRVSEATAVRGIRLRRAPLRGIRIIAVSLIRETVLEAERTTDALIARGYSDDRTPPVFTPARRDAAAVALLIGFLAGAALIALLPGP
ncbi:MAG: CbiQ family ECF transporter T component, partial [Spirochaetaceae bacterium]